MDDFLDKLQKTRTGFFSKMRLLFILDFIAVFSIIYAILIIGNLEYFLNKYSIAVPIKLIAPVLALIFAIIISILLHRGDKKINVINLIENKYPELNEKLRTAYDNRDDANVIIDSLKTIVSELINQVSPSKLLARRSIISKVILTTIFIVGVVFLSLNPQGYQIPGDTLANITKTFTGEGENTTGLTDITGVPVDIANTGTKGSGDIFGKPKIASIEGKNIDLTLYSGMDTGFQVKDTTQTNNQFIQSAMFPVDVLGSNVSDSSYSMLMQKTQTEKQLIDQYAVERSKI